jgi:PAS domain-containing protein
VTQNIYEQIKELSSIISEIDQGIAIISEGIIELCNPNFIKLLGIDRPTIRGRRIEEIIPNFDFSIQQTKKLLLQRCQKTIEIKTFLLKNDMTIPLLFLIVSEVVNQEKENIIL